MLPILILAYLTQEYIFLIISLVSLQKPLKEFKFRSIKDKFKLSLANIFCSTKLLGKYLLHTPYFMLGEYSVYTIFQVGNVGPHGS